MDGLIEGFLSHFPVVLFLTFKALYVAVNDILAPQNKVRKQRLTFIIEVGDCLLLASLFVPR